MRISVKLNEHEGALFKSYAELNKTTLSEMARIAILEKIEEEYDLKCYQEAMNEYKEKPLSYSHNEAKKMIGID